MRCWLLMICLFSLKYKVMPLFEWKSRGHVMVEERGNVNQLLWRARKQTWGKCVAYWAVFADMTFLVINVKWAWSTFSVAVFVVFRRCLPTYKHTWRRKSIGFSPGIRLKEGEKSKGIKMLTRFIFDNEHRLWTPNGVKREIRTWADWIYSVYKLKKFKSMDL